MPGSYTFHFCLYTSAANGQGVDSADKVKASHITGVRVRFIPEITQSASGKVATRSLVDANISWEEWAGKESGGDDSGDDSGNDGEAPAPTA